MVILDFDYLETAPEASDIIGGGKRKDENEPRQRRHKSEATAFADSNADAVGRSTKTETSTEAIAVVGDFSVASSSSYAKVDLSS